MQTILCCTYFHVILLSQIFAKIPVIPDTQFYVEEKFSNLRIFIHTLNYLSLQYAEVYNKLPRVPANLETVIKQ